MLCPRGDLPQTQAVIVARCCSGVHSASSAAWVTGAANAALSSHLAVHTHADMHTQQAASFHETSIEVGQYYIYCMLYLYKNIYKIDYNDMCPVLFSWCGGSQYITAGWAYLFLRSVKCEDPKMSWKGANLISPSLYTAHISPHPSPLLSARPRPCPISASLLQVLAPSMRLARRSSCRGSAVYWIGPRWHLSKEDRGAVVRPTYDDITSFQEAAAGVSVPFAVPTNIFMIIKNVFIRLVWVSLLQKMKVEFTRTETGSFVC